MKITKKTWQHRRDFEANVICESCKEEYVITGCYDDAYFFEKVMPSMKCLHCGLSRNDLKKKQK